MTKPKDIFVYDLMANLRKHPEKAKVVQGVIDQVRTLEQKIAQGKADRNEMSSALARLVPLCGFNFGLLLPYIFPRYPSTEPLSLLERPFMFAMTCFAANNRLTLRAGRQIGKCADANTEVTTRSHGQMTLGQLFDAGLPAIS